MEFIKKLNSGRKTQTSNAICTKSSQRLEERYF